MKFAFRPVGASIIVSTRLSQAAIEIHAGNFGKNIEAFRVASKPKEVVAVGEVGGQNSLERRAELGKGRIDCRGVGSVRLYEKVKVFREPGLRVINNREASDNQIFNAMGVEGGTKGLCNLGTSGSISQPFSA
jgi:hypothetical protein